MRVLTYGAIVQSIWVPDRHGELSDIVLGYSDLAGYVADQCYCGPVVGRYANRIAGGRFSLGGRVYELERNDGGNALHGGPGGLGKQLWSIEDIREGPDASVTLGYISPDGEGGYPGNLSVTATYTLEDSRLDLTLEAETDRATIVNLTGHSYFNLAGEASGLSALDHRLRIDADRFTPIDRHLIPTGDLSSVAGTSFDFRQPARVGEGLGERGNDQLRLAGGYDHNFVLADAVSSEARFAARLEEPRSGRAMELWTNQPGLQFYSGQHLGGTLPGKGGRAYRPGDGLALEPQLFPDTPNRPQFGSAELAPGQRYRNLISYRFLTVD